MTAPAANFNFLWARAIAQELHRAGVREAAVAPGSRSAPLALALLEQPDLNVRVIFDERSAAFFALGAAKASGRPAVALATSGTAGAHFYPAVLEAEASGVPLVLLTADRPPELHGFGAPQTLDQQRLYGDHVRAFADLGVPEPTEAALLHLRSVVTVGLSRALGPRRGPAHLNVPLREPLAPIAGPLPAGLSARALEGPALLLEPARFATNNQSGLFVSIADQLAARPRGIIACGTRDPRDGLAAAIAELSAATGYAVLAEAASGVREGLPSAVTTYDTLLRDERLAAALRPDAVIRVGGGLTSKLLQGFLDSASAFTVLLSDEGMLVDPAHAGTAALIGDAAASCTALAQAVASRGARPGPLALRFAAAEARARAALEVAFSQQADLCEPRIAREVAAALPPGAQLIVSSSMPIRDLDAYGGSLAGVRVLANRGANGIDGIISTALGAAAGTGRPTAVLLGDVAFLHDLGGLIAASRLSLSLTIIVSNNDGGGIFHFLPVASHAEPRAFEELFGTPHGRDLSAAAALASAQLHRPRTPGELRAAVRESLGRGLHVIEVRTDRALNVARHRELQQAVLAGLSELSWQ